MLPYLGSGPEDPGVGQTLHGLARAYWRKAEFDTDQVLLNRAVSMPGIAEFPDSSALLATLTTLAGVYLAQARYDEAEPLYRRILEARENQLGSGHLDVATSLHDLAVLHSRLDQPEEAQETERLFQRSLQIQEEHLGPGHPLVGVSLGELGDLYSRRARFDEAEPLFQRSLEIRAAAPGPDSPWAH